MSKPYNILKSSIEYLKGVGPVRAELLKKELNIHTFEDLLYHFPFRYVDKTKFNLTNENFKDGEMVQFTGEIIEKQLIRGKNNRNRLTALFKDKAGFCELLWFQRVKWMTDFIKPGKQYIVYGRIKTYAGKKSIVHPEMELLSAASLEKQSTLYPVYHTTEKLNAKNLHSKSISYLTRTLTEKLGPADLPETIPRYILKKLNLIPFSKAMLQIHFPASVREKTDAENRIKFDELFFLQLRLLLNRINRKRMIKGPEFKTVGDKFHQFYDSKLAFELTKAQKKVIKEIRYDMGSGIQMNRLLQGDVGSGKTIVALLCMLIAIDNGYQACLMAPTEILAYQHFQSINSLVEGIGINVGFLSGSIKGKNRKDLLYALQEGNIHILIGTHALIEKPVEYANLGLAITDEQHRFGVEQRAKLWMKAKTHPPHILVMTATPIPRTLSMTVYGDLDVSVIDELPKGRKEIKTIHLFESKRAKLIKFLHDEIAKGRQVYVVYPLIDESEKLDLKNLQEGYDQMLHHFPRPKYQMSVVHGRMKPADKEFEMNRFKRGETDILVATTVIEVGVDVPNASVMIIENAERFGLSQLHQLRGRVGRGTEQSFCVLMSGYKLTKDAKQRLETMVRTSNGFEIAEVDMQLRGPGDMEGTRQSGLLDFKLVNIVRDSKILTTSRHICTEVLDEDPNLTLEKNRLLRAYVLRNKHLFQSWGRIS